LGPAWFFGLPGNPVAVAVTFQQIVKPALAQLAGAPATRSLQLQAVCLDNLKKSPGRLEFMRGLLTQTSAGEFQVKSAGKQGSHILSALSRANCYIVLPAENAGVNNGDTVTVLPFGIDLGV
jgi:molybdopterin molybdotransferase